jgi:hypothetical protein
MDGKAWFHHKEKRISFPAGHTEGPPKTISSFLRK